MSEAEDKDDRRVRGYVPDMREDARRERLIVLYADERALRALGRPQSR